MESERVVVTGLGLMTGLGLDVATTWDGLMAGRTVVRRFTTFDPASVDVPVGIELPDGAEALFKARIKPRSRAQMTRSSRIALVTAAMACADAGLDAAAVDPRRVGVVIGATGSGYAHVGPARDAHRILRNMASAPAAWASLKLGFEGPSSVVSSACSSGATAFHEAWLLIVAGVCDAVVAGATDASLNAADVQGFSDLMALAEVEDDIQSLSRPFDARRTGFVMAEGAGMMVLESERHARRRGAPVRALLHRPGLSSEAYNILAPRPDGSGMARTMRLALAAAGLEPAQIDYVNAHGTSTPLNDQIETAALKDALGDHARRVPVSSTKGAHGHCLSAAAAVEGVISVLALGHQVIPPTLNLRQPDPALDLDFVPLAPRPARLDRVMSNSFAFGGQNGVCIFERCA